MMHYFDNNATTALAVAAARAAVATLVGVPADTVIFTSGGTESNAQAVWGWLRPGQARDEVVLSAVEHASVWAWRERLAAAGFTVRVAPVGRSGALDVEALAGMLGPRTALVSVMLANNETGVVYPVAEIAAMAHAAGARMHSDVAQAVGRMPVDLAALGVDAASGCAHKLHGPKGVGFLYLRNAEAWQPGWVGGGQEFGRRPGTEPVPLVAGFGAAAEAAGAWLAGGGVAAMAARRDAFEGWAVEAVSGLEVIGRDQPRLPNTSLLWIPGVETEVLLAALDMAGIACSSGSACASGAHEPSHVLAAMGWSDATAAVVRISRSRFTTDEDDRRLRDALAREAARLRG